jgi:hypothetical protein
MEVFAQSALKVETQIGIGYLLLGSPFLRQFDHWHHWASLGIIGVLG